MTALVQTGTPQRTRQWNAVIAASIGNALEWFDFVVYGFFAITIARLFFPAADEGTSLLVALATFGVTYFMRPLGAIVLGDYADRHGRKAAFSLSIVLMTLGTGIIALAPTYAAIGLWAPILMVLARCIQGFSAGGEFGAATAFTGRAAPGKTRLLCQLAIRKSGPHDCSCHRVRRGLGRCAQRRANGFLGLADSIPLRASDRTGRLLPAQPCRRNGRIPLDPRPPRTAA